MIVVYPKAIKFQETIVTIYDLSATPTFFTHNLIALRHKNSNVAGEFEMKTYVCIVCGLIYDEAAGMPSEGIPAGTLWADVPADWLCPDCGVAKSDFEMVEV
jgi:rubredoxin|tara:strand:- start:11441 stop:11746 length:306 start_codon:yes stop_codon:yes gene_type:complete